MYCTPQKADVFLLLPARIKTIPKVPKMRKGAYRKIPPSSVRIDQIIDVICEYYGVSVRALKGSYRGAEYSDVRKFVYYFIKLYEPETSLKHIGRLFNRDHSTIIYAIKSINDLLDVSKSHKIERAGLNLRLNNIVGEPKSIHNLYKILNNS